MATELSKLNQEANLAHWQQQVYECRHSGMTIKAWCEEQAISIKSYYYRQQKVWKAAQDAQASQQNREVKLNTQLQPALPAATITEAIIPCAPLIREPNHPDHPAPFLIVRKDQWTVEAANGCDPTLLRLVLRAVK